MDGSFTSRIFEYSVLLGCLAIAIIFLVAWIRRLEARRDAQEIESQKLCQAQNAAAIARIQALEDRSHGQSQDTITACHATIKDTHEVLRDVGKALPVFGEVLREVTKRIAPLLLCCLLLGCGDTPRLALDAPAPPSGTDKISLMSLPPIAKDAANAKEQAAEARAQMSFWTARLEVAEAEGKRLAAEERQRWLETACRWMIGLCFVGLLGNVGLFAASFIWPWFARLRLVALGGAAAALVLIAVLWWLPAALHWAGPLMAVAILASIAALLWHLHRQGHAQFSIPTLIKD